MPYKDAYHGTVTPFIRLTVQSYRMYERFLCVTKVYPFTGTVDLTFSYSGFMKIY